MLNFLNGRMHEVHSAVAVACGDEISVSHAVTSVRMRRLRDEELDAYAELGEGSGRPAVTPFRGRPRCSSNGSEATTRTWSGCRLL